MTNRVIFGVLVLALTMVIAAMLIRGSDVSDAQSGSDPASPVLVTVALDCGHFHPQHSNSHFRTIRWSHSGPHNQMSGPATGYESSEVQALCEAGATHQTVAATATQVPVPTATSPSAVQQTNSGSNGETNTQNDNSSNDNGSSVTNVSTASDDPSGSESTTENQSDGLTFDATLTPEEAELRQQANQRRATAVPTPTPVLPPTATPTPEPPSECEGTHRHGRSSHSHSGFNGHTHGSHSSSVNGAVYSGCKN